MSVVSTETGGFIFRWPPTGGKRRVQQQNPEEAPAGLFFSRRKLIKPQMSSDVEGSLSKSEKRRIMEEMTMSNRSPRGEELDFLSEKRWRPSGVKPAFIPAPPKVKLQSDSSPPQKVKEVNPRLLAELHRKAPPEPKQSDKKVNVEKLVSHLAENDVQNREIRLETLKKKYTGSLTPKGKKLTEDDMDEYTQRMFKGPLHQREHRHQALLRKFVHSAKPSRRLTKEEQDSATKRLYSEGVARERSTIAKAVHKYVDEVRPKSARLTEAERKETTARLYTPRP